MRGKIGMFSQRITPRQPDEISGLTGWWDASDSASLFDATTGGSVVAADGQVARFEDKSGNSRHFTQATSDNRPIRKTAVRNSLDVIRFDGSDDSMSNAATYEDVITSTACSVFIVASATSIASNGSTVYNNVTVLTSSGDPAHGFVSFKSGGTANSWGYDTGFRGTGASYSSGDWAVFTTTHDGSTLAFRVNGGSQSTETLGTRQFLNYPLTLGQNYTFWRFDGDVGEVITYNVALSNAEREEVESWLMSKWGI